LYEHSLEPTQLYSAEKNGTKWFVVKALGLQNSVLVLLGYLAAQGVCKNVSKLQSVRAKPSLITRNWTNLPT